jgi:DNA-binding transcriptional LysR family regulator
MQNSLIDVYALLCNYWCTMDTNLIYQFCAVIESGTVAKAAEVLHITPGALSRALKRLEIELDVSLFTPNGRNITPTPEARRFYVKGKEILAQISETKLNLKKKIEGFPTVRIATFEVFSSHCLAEFISQEKLEANFLILEKIPGMIEKSLLDYSADIGLTYVPFLHPELDHLPVGYMEVGIYSNSSNPNELAFAVPITDLGENITRTHSLDGWPQDKPRVIKYYFEMLETALDLATRGLCRICCPKFIVSIENKRLLPQFRLTLDDEYKTLRLKKLKVYVVKRKSSAESPDLKKLSRFLRKILQST